jgi:acyl-CoA synthetase (AMP-forming)/AMP-acid ligase II
VDLGDLKQYLKNHLPGYSIPNHFVILDKMPLTPNGKTDRNSLPEPVIQTKPL